MKLQKIKSLEVDVLKNLLVQNFVTGCTVLINRPLIDIALHIPVEAVMHDWWLALVAAARGKIIYEPQPTVLYRKGTSTFLAKSINRLHLYIYLITGKTKMGIIQYLMEYAH